MITTKTFAPRWYNIYAIHFFRFFISKILPSAWFREQLPEKSSRIAVDGFFNLETVSHCWGYSNMLNYQLSSIVNYPPTKCALCVTVFYAKEDIETKAVLDFYSKKTVEHVTWNFQSISKGKLFRRATGRNLAAHSTKAHWIWYTDCDNIFHKNCFDSLADELQGRQDILVHPMGESTTEMLSDDDPILRKNCPPEVVEIEVEKFNFTPLRKSTGPYQIVHGDVARAIGYCDKLKMFQAEETAWRKTYEDTAFKWLINSEGVAIDIKGALRIRHVSKGRYTKGSKVSRVRSKIRRLQE